jgi:hypothetical protein
VHGRNRARLISNIRCIQPAREDEDGERGVVVRVSASGGRSPGRGAWPGRVWAARSRTLCRGCLGRQATRKGWARPGRWRRGARRG